MKKEMSEIKKRALLAKQRMKMGYWQKILAERERLRRETADSSQIELVNELRKDEYIRSNKRAMGDDFAEREERLYLKVCEILNENENVTNPIGQLMDKHVYDNLDAANKQRYILELSNKFRELRERYYKEKRKYI